jgi:undecaprenyl-diphosphatase
MTAAMQMVRRLDGHDQALLARWTLSREASRLRRRAWIAITHAGGAVVTILSVLLPLVLAPWPRATTVPVALALTLSHLVVQLIKRRVHRARPPVLPHIPAPDRFSFPSGHATAALSVGLGYGLAFPALAPWLVGAALLVGWSRVVLGVHYPGDVLVGQIIAAGTVALLAVAG